MCVRVRGLGNRGSWEWGNPGNMKLGIGSGRQLKGVGNRGSGEGEFLEYGSGCRELSGSGK